ncbi:LPXTG cell wall anchor domain-containing protein, partial [Ancylothrix sp. C2]|uniref:LPXTG cell wall anchor domain-containing protein n=1 Tax=Ancylothrix sp. D3o TaxID=2953691 RepID=UPI0021BA4967
FGLAFFYKVTRLYFNYTLFKCTTAYLREDLSQAESIDEYSRQSCFTGCSSNQIFWLLFFGLIILAIGGFIYRSKIQK